MVSIVTGASGGVGRGIALSMAAHGAQVMVASRDARRAAEVLDTGKRRGLDLCFQACDVTTSTAVSACVVAAVERWGRIDAVVHNATSDRSPERADVETAPAGLWEEHAAVSMRGTFLLARSAFASLREVGGSFTLLTSSTALQGHPSLPFYASVKSAQRGMAMALAREWGPAGVRVNCVAPHADSPAKRRFAASHPEEHRRDLDRISLRRLGDPEADIGPVVSFLASPAARFVTGQTLLIDGGRFRYDE